MDFSALNPLSSNGVNLAARNGDVKVLRRLVRAGRSPNLTDNRGWTALHEAAAADHPEVLRLLLRCPGVRPLALTHEGQSALFVACRHNATLSTVQLLLSSAPELLNLLTPELVSVLHLAAILSNGPLLQELLAAGAQIDLQDADGDTPLHEAARTGCASTVSALLHAGADPTIRNIYGLTPFLLTCFKGSLECATIFLVFESDINDCGYDGNTALLLAAQKGAANLVSFLLENDADPNSLNNDGISSLHASLMYGHPDVFRILLPVTDTAVIRQDIFNNACKPHFFMKDIVVTLLESDLKPEFFNESDEFIQMLEIIFDMLPEYNISPPLCSILNVAEYVYKTSEDLSETLLSLLLTKGVAVDAMYKEECPPLVYLHYCDHTKCYTQIIELLINHGCNVDYCTLTCNETLHIPDAIIASIATNGQTLSTLLKYSLMIDPEDVVYKLIEYNMIGQRISIEVIEKILPWCYLSMEAYEKLKKQLNPYLKELDDYQIGVILEMLTPCVASLKHLCRKSIRSRLRLKASSTQDFFKTLSKLRLPVVLKLYLRFS